jgi:hypothetical protein
VAQMWQNVFRVGLAPQLTEDDLLALAGGLEADDRRLAQGCTSDPPPMKGLWDFPVHTCCPISFVGLVARGLATVGQVDEWFAQVCFRIDELFGEKAASRWLLNYLDDTPRERMREELLAEVRAELARRGVDPSPDEQAAAAGEAA